MIAGYNMVAADVAARKAEKQRGRGVLENAEAQIASNIIAANVRQELYEDGCNVLLPEDKQVDVWAEVQRRRVEGDPLMLGGQYKETPTEPSGWSEGKGIPGSRRKDMGMSR